MPPPPSKLARIKAKAQAIAAKKNQLAASELTTSNYVTAKFAEQAALKLEIKALQIEMDDEVGSITDLEGVDPVPTKASRV